MGGSSTTLSIVPKLVDDASAAMAGVASNLKSIGDSMTSSGRTLTTDVTLPIAGIGTAATKMAADFQSSMTQLVTQAGLPADQLANLTTQLQAFADSGAQQTPDVLAKGLYHIVSLGVPAADAMKVLKLASEGAAMGHANLEDVSTALGAAVASNIKGSGDYQNTMATLNATVGAGNMRMGDLATSLGNVLPQATTAGLSLKDVGAAMATMTDNGMPAQDAATRLHMAISLMEAPSGKAKTALDSIGMSQFQLADDMRNKGLLPALQDLHDHLTNSGKTADQQAAVISDAFGGGRSAGAIELLLNNLDRVGQKYTLIGQGVNKFSDDVQAQQATAAAKFAEAQAQMADAMVKLGAAMLPLIETVMPKLLDAVTFLVTLFTNLPGPVQNGILIFLGLLAVLGPILVVVGSLITVVGTLSTVFGFIWPVIAAVGAAIAAIGWPITLAIAAVALLAVAVYTHWSQIIDWTSNMMLSIAGAWNTGWTGMSNFLTGLLDDMKTAVQDALNFIMGIVNNIIGAINSVKNAAASIGGAVGGFVGGSVNSAAGFFSSITHVNDAIITPGGQVIQTDPADYLIATKNPGSLGGSGGITINITGNNISNQLDVRNMAQQVGAEIVRVLRLNQKLSI